jgi:hypothetical protein
MMNLTQSSRRKKQGVPAKWIVDADGGVKGLEHKVYNVTVTIHSLENAAQFSIPY